jgi:hypothetical protein
MNANHVSTAQRHNEDRKSGTPNKQIMKHTEQPCDVTSCGQWHLFSEVKMWAAHEARMRRKILSDYLSEKLKERDQSGDLGLDVRIILKWILEKYGVRAWTESKWLRMGGQWRDHLNTVMNFWLPVVSPPCRGGGACLLQ